jgi:2-haloacid dehalogenase
MQPSPHTKALTFDCYGTLIDWESGILAALQPFLQSKGINIADEQLLELYAELEPQAESGPFKCYKDVLALVMQSLAQRLGFQLNEGEKSLLSGSIANWPAFPDTVEALKRLEKKYKLCILSNIDEDLIQTSLPHLQVDFHLIISAEQVKAYKPSTAHFEAAMAQLALPKTEMLHCAQSLYHDIKVAGKLGIPNVWINRRKNKPGGGATPPSDAQADHEVGSMQELADWLLGPA